MMKLGCFLVAAAAVPAVFTMAGCGSPSRPADLADSGGTTDVKTADSGKPHTVSPDAAMPDGTEPDGGPRMADGSPMDGSTGKPDAEGGVHPSTCTPAKVFVLPWFPVTGGGGTRDTVAGDLNNDGLTDLVDLGGGGGSIAFTVNLNKGNKTFAPAASYDGTPSEGEGVALGDIDGDGYLDVLFASFYDGSLSEPAVAVSFNNKNGTFSSTPVTFDAPGGFPEVIRTADVNNDGKIDVVAILQDTGVVVMLNQGGTLGTPIPVNISADSDDVGHLMDLADFDGDGNIDIVTLGPCVALGMGNGSFKPSTCYPSAPNILEIEAVVAGDLNGDGKPDIVQYNYDSTTDAADIFLNQGKGTFAAYTSVGLSDDAVYDGQLADMNNDGKLDALFFNGPDSLVYVEYGKGDGTFAPYPEEFALGVALSSDGAGAGGVLMLGNFLGNGLPGFATLTTTGYEVVPAICRTTIPPSQPIFDGDSGVPKSTCATSKVKLTAHQTTTASAIGGGSSRAVDLNGDGKADLAWAGGSQGGTAFSYQLSNGDGTFKSAVEVPGLLFGTVMATGDFNNDGLPDIIYGAIQSGIGSSAGLGVALNAGGGMFNLATFTPMVDASAAFSALEVADVNNDGYLDAIVDGQLALGFGDGTFNAPGVPTPFFPADSARPYRFVDVNGDGQLDVVFLQSGGFCTALNISSGNFAAPICTGQQAPQAGVAFAVGDVNGDQKIDVVVINEVTSAGVYVFLGNGDGTFKAPMTSDLPDINANLVELADFNNDGNLDLLVWSQAGTTDSAQLSLLPGAGNGTFAATGQTFTAGSPLLDLQISIGDFAGNGLLGFAIEDSNRPGFDVVLPTCSP